MTEENKTYIRQLKVADVPWHRLTTAYGRGSIVCLIKVNVMWD